MRIIQQHKCFEVTGSERNYLSLLWPISFILGAFPHQLYGKQFFSKIISLTDESSCATDVHIKSPGTETQILGLQYNGTDLVDFRRDDVNAIKAS